MSKASIDLAVIALGCFGFGAVVAIAVGYALKHLKGWAGWM